MESNYLKAKKQGCRTCKRRKGKGKKVIKKDKIEVKLCKCIVKERLNGEDGIRKKDSNQIVTYQ